MQVYNYTPVFKKTELENGVRVVTENHPLTRSAAVGVFATVGTRDEEQNIAGATHFLEHLVFKGTKKRSAYEISKELEAVGGDLNAYTTREYTCFHATSLREHLPIGLDVCTDLVTSARLGVSDFEKEREVILQEIEMTKDDFEEYISDLYQEHVYKGHSLGTPILGTPQSLNAMTRADINRYYKRHYRGSQIIVSVAGNVQHEEVVGWVEKSMLKMKAKRSSKSRSAPRFRKFQEFIHRPSEQTHILLGWPSCSFKSEHRFESYIVNAMLGGGMTSRLYQRVRERRGLVYSIYSFLQSFVDSGLFQVYAGASNKNALIVMELVREEMQKFLSKPIRVNELEFYKTQVKGQILLGAEDMENRMNSLAVNEMVFEEYRPVESVIAEIDKVTVKSLRDYVKRYFDLDKTSVMVMGDLTAKQALPLLEVFK
jgi:predicted Zn-dependent peptidase